VGRGDLGFSGDYQFFPNVNQMGKWIEAKSVNKKTVESLGFNSITIPLDNGKGEARFTYSGRQIVAPYITFTALLPESFPPAGYFSNVANVDGYAKTHPYIWLGGPQTKPVQFTTIRIPTRNDIHQTTSHINWLLWLFMSLTSLLVIGLLDTAYWHHRLRAAANSPKAKN
jgi:hypothetical protein